MKKEQLNLGEKFNQWLDNLQQESWQLEMIISGLSIALIAGVYQDLNEYISVTLNWRIASESAMFLSFIPIFASLSLFYLILNLIIHLLLRGLWIATIGLRYVSGDIDYDKLHYNSYFNDFLSKRIGSFDNYIERLEKLCSSIFAFTFLIIFCILSSMLFMLAIFAVSTFVNEVIGSFLPESSTEFIRRFTLITLFICGLLYFIDFVTLGFFKKRKKYFAWYRPIYRLLSWITLANIYRPIYHNFIDNKFGRSFAYLIIPYILASFLLTSFQVDTHKYIAEEGADLFTFGRRDYDDRYEDNYIDKFMPAASIYSPYVSNGFLEISLPYYPIFDDRVLDTICGEHEFIKETGINSNGAIRLDLESTRSHDELLAEAVFSLECLKKLWRVSINDSIIYEIDFLFDNKIKEQGLKAIVDIIEEKRGHHILKLEKKRIKNDSTYFRTNAIIHFWKE